MNFRRYFLMFIIFVSSFMIYTNNVKAIINPTWTYNASASYGRNSGNGNVTTYTGSYTLGSITFRGWYNDATNVVSFGRVAFNASQTLNGTYSVAFILGLESQTGINESINMSVVSANGSPCVVNLITKRNNLNGWSSVYCENVDFSNTSRLNIDILSNNITTFVVGNISIFDSNNLSLVNEYLDNILRTLRGYNLQGIMDAINANGILLSQLVSNDATIISKLTDIIAKLESSNTTQTQINQNTEQIKNDIKDSSIDNDSTSSSASSWASKNASNGTITQLLTLPISLLTNITNSINSSCSSFSLGTLFDTELVLPCINLQDYLGSTLVSIIDLLFSGFMIYNIAKKLIKIFNDFTNLKSNQIDEIYGGGNE